MFSFNFRASHVPINNKTAPKLLYFLKYHLRRDIFFKSSCSLIKSQTTKNITLRDISQNKYFFQVGAIHNSSEYRLGILKNGKVNTGNSRYYSPFFFFFFDKNI